MRVETQSNMRRGKNKPEDEYEQIVDFSIQRNLDIKLEKIMKPLISQQRPIRISNYWHHLVLSNLAFSNLAFKVEHDRDGENLVKMLLQNFKLDTKHNRVSYHRKHKLVIVSTQENITTIFNELQKCRELHLKVKPIKATTPGREPPSEKPPVVVIREKIKLPETPKKSKDIKTKRTDNRRKLLNGCRGTRNEKSSCYYRLKAKDNLSSSQIFSVKKISVKEISVKEIIDRYYSEVRFFTRVKFEGTTPTDVRQEMLVRAAAAEKSRWPSWLHGASARTLSFYWPELKYDTPSKDLKKAESTRKKNMTLQHRSSGRCRLRSV